MTTYDMPLDTPPEQPQELVHAVDHDGQLVAMSAEDLAVLLDRYHKAELILNHILDVIADTEDNEQMNEVQFSGRSLMQTYYEGMRDATRFFMTGQPPEAPNV